MSTNDINNSSIVLVVVPNWSQLTSEVLNDKEWQNFGKPQHLYILSDDKIIDGDWCIDTYKQKNGLNPIFKWSDKLHVDAKKIIATTDAALNLPLIPEAFISSYVTEYNENNEIEWVNVEYDVTHVSGAVDIEDMFEFGDYDIIKVKVDKKKCIVIKKIKDSWNRKELELIMQKYGDYVCNAVIEKRKPHYKSSKEYLDDFAAER